MNKEIAYSLLTIKAIDDEKRVIRGMATTPEPDRVGDVVEPLGAIFGKNLPLLWMHRHDLPVGTVNFGTPTKAGIPFEATLPIVNEPSQLKARIDEAWQSVKAGIIRAVSIGFRPLEYSVIEETGGYRFTRTEIYELSLVTVPANAGATITEVKAFDRQTRAALGNKGFAIKPPSGVADKPKSKSVKLTPKEGNTMSIADKVKAFKAEVIAKEAKMAEMMEGSLEGGVTFTAEEKDAYETLESEVKELGDHIVKAENLMKHQIATAKPVAEKDGLTEKAGLTVRTNSIKVRQEEKLEKGIMFTRYVMALAKAKGDHGKAFNIANEYYGDESAITRVLGAQSKGADFEGMMKAAIAAGSTITGSSATWGSELVDFNTFVGDFIDFLRPQTILGKFGLNGVPSLRQIPFNVKIKGQTGAATAGWVGEGLAKPVTSMAFNDVELGFYKVACIAVITEELIRFSSPSAERLVREELARAVIERLDIDFINPAKALVAGISPASILNGITPIPSTGTDADAINCDLQALEAAFIEANNDPLNGVYIMRPSTANVLARLQNPMGQSMYLGISMRGGTLNGTPVIVSNYVPQGIVALINASDIYLADDGQVTVDASREATIQMDTAPTQSSVAPTPSTGVSMFQTNSVAIRAERYINWARRRDAGVAYLNGVEWSACPVVS